MQRKMGDFNVTQRTKDSMFNATELLKQWNGQVNSKDGNSPVKEMGDFFRSKKTKEFISTLEKDDEFLNAKNLAYLKTRGKYGGTWMHPYLFIDFAMWINPTFKLQVIKFVYDEMIKYRNEAGSAYTLLGKSIQKLVPKDFIPKAMQKVSEGINHVVFNNHEKGIRNKFGNEDKQRELLQLETKLSELIEEGFIISYTDVVKYLRTQYHKKNNPKVFLNV